MPSKYKKINSIKRIYIILLFMFLFSILQGCSKEKLLLKIIETNSEINSYNYGQSLDMAIEYMNHSSKFPAKKEYMNHSSFHAKINGTIDRTSKKMSLNGLLKNPDLNFEKSIIMYIEGVYFYQKLLNNWIRIRTDDNTFKQFDVLLHNIDLLRHGNITDIDKKSLDDVSYLAVNVSLDFNKVIESSMNQAQLNILDFLSESNLNNSMLNYNVIILVNRKTKMLKNIEERLEIITENKNSGKIYLKVINKIEFTNFNGKIDFVLPVETSYAADVTYQAIIQKYHKNASECEAFTDTTIKDKCYSEVSHLTKNLSLCNNIDTDEMRYDCIQFIAGTNENLSICDEIPVGEKRDFCYSIANRFKREVKVCDMMSTKKYRDDCIAISNKEDPNSCETIENQHTRDNCYNVLAQKLKNASLCENIAEKYARQGCTITVRLEENNETICDEYIGIDKDNCLIRLSIKMNSVEICSKISISAGYDQCYREIGIKMQNISICERIVNDFQRDKCLISINNKNWALCEKIKNEASRQICLNEIG